MESSYSYVPEIKLTQFVSFSATTWNMNCSDQHPTMVHERLAARLRHYSSVACM